MIANADHTPAKRIVISGWYGPNNFGDEAILEAIVDQLYSTGLIDEATHVSVLGVRPRKTKELFPDLSSYYQFPNDGRQLLKSIITLDIFKTIYQIVRSEYLFVGGGGFLSDWQSNNIGWLGQIVLGKIFRTKVKLWGVGIGPFIRPFSTQLAAQVFRRCVDEAYVRDKVSENCLRGQLGYQGKIRTEPDPVAGFQVNKYLHANQAREQHITFIPAEYFKNIRHADSENSWSELYSCFIKAILHIASQGIPVKVLFFQPDAETDLFKAMQLDTKSELVELLSLADHREALKVIARSRGVISFRLHGNIMSYACKTPFLPIIYHFKGLEFLKMVNREAIPKIMVGDGVHLEFHKIQWSEWKSSIDEFLSITS